MSRADSTESPEQGGPGDLAATAAAGDPGKGGVAVTPATGEAPARAMRVVHVITALGPAGAETMLYRLVSATRRGGVAHSVVSLTDSGYIGSMLTADGVPVTSLGMRPGVPDPRAIVTLVRLLRRERPDLVQSWMYHADLIAGVAAAVAGRIPVVWGVHYADVDARAAKRLTHWTRSVCARLSGVLPARIVCCAHAALRAHADLGYRTDRMLVIPNGFDTELFSADPGTRARIRRELSIPDGAPVVGLVARLHPDKDHPNFLAAARVVAAAERDAIFVLAGSGMEWSNRVLAGAIDELGLRPRFRLLAVRHDVPAILSAIDVLASSSRLEAFPMVLGEAMSCGVPCAVTDCGDSREIVGQTGRVVPTRDPDALAGAILELLALPPSARAARAHAARESVRARYDIRVIARRYTALYEEVLDGRRRRASS